MLSLALALGASGAAAAPSDATRSEARRRFDRALRLFNEGDNDGALAEFTRVYELIPNEFVLFNIARVHVVKGNPVKAVAAYDKLLAAPGKLGEEQLARAKRERTEQAERIGTLVISVEAPGAIVSIDGLQVATLPLDGPLPVASGTRIVGITAPGRLPFRREVVVSGGSTVTLKPDLPEAEKAVASLRVGVKLLDVDILVDGKKVATTPVDAPLPVAPGRHIIEARRKGYQSVRRELTVAPGSEGTFEPSLVVDDGAVARSGGTLDLTLSEPNATVFIDGTPVNRDLASLRLAPGRHRLRIEHGHFLPTDRTVSVPVGGTASVDVDLEPTPTYRAEYAAAARSQQFWGWVTVASGGLFMVGSGVFLGINAADEADKEDAFGATERKFESGGECDATAGLQTDACDEELRIRLQSLQDVRDQAVFGWVGLGVGAVATGVGVFILVSGNDPDRYEPRPESDVFGSLRLDPLLLPGSVAGVPGGGGAVLRGRF